MAKPKSSGLLLVGVGSILASMAITGFLLGFLVDLLLDTKPIFLLLLGFMGIVGGTLKAHRMLTHPGFN